MRIYPDLQTIYDKVRHLANLEYGIIVNSSQLEFQTFTQTFSDTAGILRANASDFAGQAFTDCVITVAHDTEHDIYFVFQDDTPVYGVTAKDSATGFKAFLTDLAAHTLKPKYIALDIYNKE